MKILSFINLCAALLASSLLLSACAPGQPTAAAPTAAFLNSPAASPTSASTPLPSRSAARTATQTPTSAPTQSPTAAKLPQAHNGPIAFARGGGIYLADPVSGSVKQLVAPGGYSEPAWSAQGDRLAYIRKSIQSGRPAFEVYTFDLASQKGSLLVPAQSSGTMLGGVLSFSNPRWSPDGAWLYFISADGTNAGYLINKVDSRTGKRAASFLQIPARFFDISPLSGRIAFSDYHQIGWSLNLADGNSGQERVIVPLQEQLFGMPAWSPDGQAVGLIISDVNRKSPSLKIFNDQGQTLQTIALGIIPTNIPILDWSPDGTRLVYDANNNLYIMEMKTGKSTLLAEGSQPSWGAAQP